MFKKNALVLLAVAAMSTSAFADGKQWWLAPQAGLAVITPAGVGVNGTAFTWGAQGGYKLTPDWSLGAYFTTSTPATGLYSSNIYGMINYHGFFDGFYAGIRLGLLMSGTAAASSSGFRYGLNAGYDIGLNDMISIGLQASWGVATVSSATGSIIDFVVPVKFWF